MGFLSKIGIFLSVGFIFLIFSVFFLLPISVFSEADFFFRGLGMGDRGADVLRLQQFLNTDPDTVVAISGAGSAGFETQVFGQFTRSAVKKFQKKYASEILFYGQAPTGYVGPKTLRKLNGLYAGRDAGIVLPNPVSTLIPKSVKSPPKNISRTPTILSVYPDRVRRGNAVTVTGTNFTPTGNSIVLMDGPVYKRFDNLNSSDGRTIIFVFEPPTIKTMTEEEIRALPSSAVSQIEGPIKAADKTLADALSPYKNINSEAELRASLKKNGHSFDEIYNFYFVSVENSQGQAVSSKALLHGLRSLPITGLAANNSESTLSSFGDYVGKFFGTIFPVAYAQGGQYGGGINSGIIMICTCGDGYLTFMTDYNGAGSGLYWFSWGFRADAGAGFITPNWLGGFETMSAECSIYVGEDCIDINANEPEKPWGTNL